ncbi:helix-turn-helix transcriptional regulator [bacterium AH-315-P13]|nr:helix-turn-helix transcriptional regulator [bacterium AH-315-P13]
MILKYQKITLFKKNVFERLVVKPPFKKIHSNYKNACFLYVLEGSSNSYSEEGKTIIHENEGVSIRCENFITKLISNSETGKCEILAIHFYPEVIRQIYQNEIPEFQTNEYHAPFESNLGHVKSNVLIRKYIESLLYYFENPKLINEKLLILKVKEIILLLLDTKEYYSISEVLHNLFSYTSFSFKEVIEKNIYSPITVPELAQLTNKSVSSFKREFRKIYSDTPANYIKNKRLEKAAKLLIISDNTTISTIAFECQFSHVSHFSDSFKKKYNISPLNYRLTQLLK